MPKELSNPCLGAQLYTVRQFCKTIAEAAESLKKVAAIGYTAVQLSGFGPAKPEEVAKVVTDAGLAMAATHVGWDQLRDKTDEVIAQHKLWNCRHIAIGGLWGEYFTLDGMKRFRDELAVVAPKLAAEGMDFSYHNHSHELARFGGRTWLERLYETIPAEHLKAELDTYWIAHGGGSPAAWIARYPGRQPLLHLKDMAVSLEPREQRFAEIGEGNLDWPGILKAASKAGVEWYLVEQDQSYGRDPFESLAISYRNLKAMGLR
ncbi:MAG: sugar phosphate isomerase/epimerase family protein [Phycisphaerae bacterium]